MTQVSITASPVFCARVLRSERWRASLLLCVWGIALVTTIVRRALHGVVMSDDRIFYSTISLLAFAILFQMVVIVQVGRFVRSGRPPHRGIWLISATVDLCIPVAALAILQVLLKEDHYGALTAPAILGLPMVTMLSILRLKPWVSLWTGLLAGASHSILATVAIYKGEIELYHHPVLYTYGVFLAIGGVVAAVISKHARAYVSEAVAEAVAAEQAQRSLMAMERDLEVARDIQQGLMPSVTPSIPGFDIAGMARPAQQTGGDYYDWQQIADGRLVVALADVTGHGIGPALVMAVCRAYARASAPAAPDPESLLRQINSLIYDDLAASGRFITMVIAIVSPDGRIELVSAGHGPTLLYRAATREVEVFGGDGIPLGIDAAEKYGPHAALQLAPGDVLLMLTDGFMEWHRESDNAQFGVERLRFALRDCASAPARSILERVDQAVQSFAAGAPQLDDTTAVAIKRV